MSDLPPARETDAVYPTGDEEPPADIPPDRIEVIEDDPFPGEHEGLERKAFLEHLSDLRVVLVKVIVAFILSAVVCLIVVKPVLRFLEMPLRTVEARQGLEAITLKILGPGEGIVALMTVTFSGAFALSLPFSLYFIAGFLAPALTRREKRMLVPGLVSGAVLFFAGVAFAFFVTFPFLLNFLWSLYTTGMGWENVWTVRFYIGFLTKFLLATGLTFELPLVLTILVRLEVLTIEQLQQRRRHAIVIMLVASAMLTPPDATSMFMVAGPMYLLYEVSIIVSKVLARRRRHSSSE